MGHEACATGTLYLGDTNGYLYAFGLDGTQKWRLLIGNSSNITNAFMAVDAAGSLYVPLTGNKLAKVGPDVTDPIIAVATIGLAGAVSDDFSLPPTVSVAGVDYPVDGGTGAFQAEISLASNPQTIEVRAADANMNQKIVNVTVSSM